VPPLNFIDRADCVEALEDILSASQSRQATRHFKNHIPRLSWAMSLVPLAAGPGAKLLDIGSKLDILEVFRDRHGYSRIDGSAYLPEGAPYSEPAPDNPDQTVYHFNGERALIPCEPGTYDIVTCFEVIEHITSPTAALTDMLSFLADQGCIVLGEALQPPDIDRVRGNWWYVAPRNGHVSTFADRTLVALADRHGMVYHRGEPHALVRGSSFAELGGRFGSPLACFRLGAPGQHREGEWHGVERDRHGPFQWTAAETLAWRVTTPPGPPRQLQIMLPFAHESRLGFAADCRIRIDGTAVDIALRESCIFAESTTVMRGDVTVMLNTPPMTGAGDRRLGLAIKVPGIAPVASRAGER